MFTTVQQQEMTSLLKIFVDDNHKLYGGHAYSAGFMEIMIAQMLPYMPKRVQRDFIADVERAAVRTRSRLLEAQNESRTFERV